MNGLISLPKYGKLLASVNAAAAGTVEFKSFLNSGYRRYKVVGGLLVPSVDDAGLLFRVSEDGGATYKAGASDYHWTVFTNLTGTNAGTNSTADTSIPAVYPTVTGRLGINANETAHFELDIWTPSDTTKGKLFRSTVTTLDSNPSLRNAVIVGQYKGTTNAIDSFEFLPTSGTISGYFELFGLERTA